MERSDLPGRPRGWVEFAGWFYVIAALLNGIAGTVMLSRKGIFDPNDLVFAKLSFWGTLLLVAAVVQLILGVLILRGTTFGRIAGIGMGILSLGLWFLVIFVAPIWSVVLIALYGILVYGLTAHRDEFRKEADLGERPLFTEDQRDV